MSKNKNSNKRFKEYVCDGDKFIGFWISYYYKRKKSIRSYFKLGKLHCELKQNFNTDETLKKETLYIN